MKLVDVFTIMASCRVVEGKLLDAPTRTPEEIAKHHGVDISVILRQLKMGIGVEGEHTHHKDVAREIALDHLWEMPDYYTKLKKVEGNDPS